MIHLRCDGRSLDVSERILGLRGGRASEGDLKARLARHRIWTRAFPYSTGWLRLGLPGTVAEWARLETALASRP